MTTLAAAPVLVHDNGAVRTVTLNRPEKRNAIDLELRIALADAIEAADADADVRVDRADRCRPGILLGR